MVTPGVLRNLPRVSDQSDHSQIDLLIFNLIVRLDSYFSTVNFISSTLNA